MTEENRYIENLKIEDVPWHRITTPYSRATEFPQYLENIREMKDMESVDEALGEIKNNIEHQETLWHATPFAMIFLTRILEQVLALEERNEIAQFLGKELLDFFCVIAECSVESNDMEQEVPLPHFSDMLSEKYLWSEEYDEEEDEIRWEDEEVFPDDLSYSFYYYSYKTLCRIKEKLERCTQGEFQPEIGRLLEIMQQ